MDKGDPVSTYKVADMYRNGYYVEKDQKRYEQIIEELYPKVKDMATFMYGDYEQRLESVMEGDECTVCFNGKWYHSRDDFFKDASIDGTKLTAIYDDLYGFEVEE